MAWALRPPPDPVVITDPVPPRFRDARPLPAIATQRVQRQVNQQASEIGARCGRNAVVEAEVLVETDGRIAYARVEPTAKVDVDCVERALMRIRLRNGPQTEGTAHVTLRL